MTLLAGIVTLVVNIVANVVVNVYNHRLSMTQQAAAAEAERSLEQQKASLHADPAGDRDGGRQGRDAQYQLLSRGGPAPGRPGHKAAPKRPVWEPVTRRARNARSLLG